MNAKTSLNQAAAPAVKPPLDNLCEGCKQKDLLIANLYKCIEEQKGSIETLHKMLDKNIA